MDAPKAVCEKPQEPLGAQGALTLNMREASLLLLDAEKHALRVAWEKTNDRKAAPARGEPRALPAGRYTVTGYRVVRTDTQDRPWFLSVTKADATFVEVEAGEVRSVEIDDSIRFTFKARAKDDKLALQMNIQSPTRGGLSIYKDGKRIPIRYRILGPDGKELASGAMNYG